MQSRVKAVDIPDKVLEQQGCPWCKSDKFNVDFDSLFEKGGREKSGSGRGVRPSQGKQVGVSTTNEPLIEEAQDDDLFSSGFGSFNIGSDPHLNLRSGSIVAHMKEADVRRSNYLTRSGSLAGQVKSIKEQKMTQFDNIQNGELVTFNDFKMNVM